MICCIPCLISFLLMVTQRTGTFDIWPRSIIPSVLVVTLNDAHRCFTTTFQIQQNYFSTNESELDKLGKLSDDRKNYLSSPHFANFYMKEDSNKPFPIFSNHLYLVARNTEFKNAHRWASAGFTWDFESHGLSVCGLCRRACHSRSTDAAIPYHLAQHQ